MSTAEIPCDMCYWDLIDCDGPAPTGDAIVYAAESRLPVPAESVSWSSVRVSQGIVFCGVDHQRLAAWIEESSLNSWRICPQELPQWLVEAGVNPRYTKQLNLRYASHEHPSRRRWRVMFTILPSLVMVALTLIVISGLLSRLGEERNQAARLVLSADSLVRQHAPPAEGSPLPPAERLIQELRRLRLADKGGEGEDATGWSAPHLLNALLAAWPRGERVQVSDLNVDGDALTIRCRVPDAQTAQRVRESVANLTGPLGRHWHCPAVDIAPAGLDQQLTLVWRPDSVPVGAP